MKLFYTPNSPYARIARIAAYEASLDERLEYVVVEVRSLDSLLLAYSPVCRVPTLVDGELVLGEARNICAYFDVLVGAPKLVPTRDTDQWTYRSDESMVVGFLDGVAVWVRELRRPTAQQSKFLLGVEEARATRCLDLFERRCRTNAIAFEAWHFTEIALACALGLIDHSLSSFSWRASNPALAAWFATRSDLPSMQATMPLDG